jgi:excisionase family DNA binding protein
MRANLEKKTVRSVQTPIEQRLLIDRRNAAQYLSISQRSLDYLLAHGELHTRRIGSRVLIPISELQRYARTDHKRLAS